MFYFVVTLYDSHNLALLSPELYGPYTSAEERLRDIEERRSNDEWDLEERGAMILLLDLRDQKLVAAGWIEPSATAYDSNPVEVNYEE